MPRRDKQFIHPIIEEDMKSISMILGDVEKLKNSSVFISGAAGMVVSYTVYYLVYLNEMYDYGIQIYAEVRSRNKAEARFGEYLSRPYFHLVIGDVIEICNIGANVDYIIHAASPASPQFYGAMPVETMLPNIVGTYNLLEIAKKLNLKKFLFFSTGAVYGDIQGVTAIKENMSGYLDYTSPGAVYAESKRCGEALCLAYFREFGVPVTILRINHTYGPTLDLNGDKRAFAEFVKNVVDGKNIEMKSDGTDKRAFCYLSDATAIILKVLLQGNSGESYNLVNEEQFISIRELAEILINLFPQKNLSVICKTRKDEGYIPLSQVAPVTADGGKIRELGCVTPTSVKEGFKRTVLYFTDITKNGYT